MKKIPLKNVEIFINNSTTPLVFCYREAIIGLISNYVSNTGCSASGIDSALKIINFLKIKNTEFMNLHDNDFLFLKNIVENFNGWKLIHNVVVDFTKDIIFAETV